MSVNERLIIVSIASLLNSLHMKNRITEYAVRMRLAIGVSLSLSILVLETVS